MHISQLYAFNSYSLTHKICSFYLCITNIPPKKILRNKSTTDCDKIFEKYVSDKWPVYEIYKRLMINMRRKTAQLMSGQNYE